jgi:cobalamin biosynthetic protein CobC
MAVDRIETVEHGGDIAAVRLRFPAAPEPWIDLSTGINPYAYPVPPLDAEMWRRLPQSDDERALLQAAAQRYGVRSADCILAAPGSQALIQVIPRLIEPCDVGVLGPTYGEHAASWTRCGHRIRNLSSLSEVGGDGVVVVVNPNNPTGTIIPPDELRGLAGELAQRRGLLVVDEAFADFAGPGISVIPQLPPATIVLRSFGKAYGLAGLRLGFAVAHVGLCRRLRAELGPWAVSGPAAYIGAAALADDHWLAEAAARLADEARRLDALLQANDFDLQGGTLLFRLVSHGSARSIVEGLGRAGIHVRRFPAQSSWLRFGLPGSEQAWQRLATALR